MDKGKFVFFDIDGTIYDYTNGTPDSTREAIRLLRENGHHPVICTGRTRVMIFDSIINLGFDGIISGAGTHVEWKGKTLRNEELPADEAKRVIECMRRNGFCSYAEGYEEFYYDAEMVANGADYIYKIYKKEIPEHVLPIDFSKEMHIAKVSAMYTPESNREKVLEELGDDFTWADHSGVLFETIKKGSSKGDGVKILINYLQRSIDDTYGFGDSMNDLDMLKTVKYGVCMGNGKEELKKQGGYVTESMLEDGVYNALKRFGLI